MKKVSLLIVFLGLASGILGGCHSSPQLSESGQALSRLFEIADQMELEKAKLEGVYERQQKAIAFNQLIVQVEKKILAENKDSQPLSIGGQEYGIEEITADLNQRQEKVKQLEAKAAASRERLDSQLNRLEAQNKLVASTEGNLRLSGQEEEIFLAKLQALLTFEAVANSLKASSAKKSADRLAEALKAFQNLLDQALDQAKAVPGDLEAMEEEMEEAIDAGLLLYERNPLIPNSHWLEYLAAEGFREQQRQQAEAERKQKEAEEQQRQQAEAERKQKEAEEQQRQQTEAEKQRKVAEEQQRQQAEAEKQRKVAEEQQRQQAEAEKKQKEAEEEQRQQAEAEKKQKEAEEEQRQQAEVERRRKKAEEQPYRQAEIEKNQKDQIDCIIADWQSFWQKLGIEADLSAVKIPEYQPEFSRVLIIPQGLTLNQVIQFCKVHFPVSSYWNDLDKAIVANDRRPTQSYAVRLRGRQEADEELKNFLPNDLAKKKIAGVTLLERLVYELKYFDETGDHLDKTNCTLCSGSRDVGGYVPYVHWFGGRLDVIWYNPGFAYGHLRARAVVSRDSP